MRHYQALTDIIYNKHFKNQSHDMVIGHSMGGLILLDMLIKHYPLQVNQIIICESFINEPNQAFKNLVYQNESLENHLIKTMKAEKPRYHDDLLQSLQTLNIRKDVKAITTPITWIYGMRALSQAAFKQALSFVEHPNITLLGMPKTAHFCLIEDEAQFKSLLKHHVKQHRKMVGA